MSLVLTVAAAIALAAWLYLVFLHGGFWRADQRLPRDAADSTPAPVSWPAIVAVIPARDEAAAIGDAVASLLRQDYPGDLAVIVVDDHSSDGTADIARAAAAALGAAGRLTIIPAPALPAGWSGKLWAMESGLAALPEAARYVLLTDADIVHGPDAVRRLAAKAEAEGLDLASLMVRLRCESAAEALLIPAFVYFFQKLYPFRRVNDPRRAEAGAAGGCMLVRRAALDRIGGMAAIRSALIDDCALAAAIKRPGVNASPTGSTAGRRHPIWLGLADDSVSVRRYDTIASIWRMVARTAYTQLRYSPAALAGTVLGMALLYLVPPAALVLGSALGAWPLAAMGGLALALMLLSYVPTWRDYRGRSPWFVLLPVAALLYTAMTVDSALRHWRGKGGAWKGRVYPRAG